jgi:hypothetical protein
MWRKMEPRYSIMLSPSRYLGSAGSASVASGVRIAAGALLVLLGAAAAITGPFFSWARVILTSAAPASKSMVLHPSGWNGDGNVVFGVGIAAVVIGVLLLWRDTGRWGTLLRSAALMCGLAIVAVTYWDTTHVSSRFSHVVQQIAAEKRIGGVAPRLRTRVDPGIVIAAGGGVLLIFAAVVDRLLADTVVVEVEDWPREVPAH